MTDTHILTNRSTRSTATVLDDAQQHNYNIQCTRMYGEVGWSRGEPIMPFQPPRMLDASSVQDSVHDTSTRHCLDLFLALPKVGSMNPVTENGSIGAAWEVFVCYMLIVCLLLMLIAIRLGKADINKREPPPGMDLQLNNNHLQPASPHLQGDENGWPSPATSYIGI